MAAMQQPGDIMLLHRGSIGVMPPIASGAFPGVHRNTARRCSRKSRASLLRSRSGNRSSPPTEENCILLIFLDYFKKTLTPHDEFRPPLSGLCQQPLRPVGNLRIGQTAPNGHFAEKLNSARAFIPFRAILVLSTKNLCNIGLGRADLGRLN